MDFPKTLIDWYLLNRRDLPWRRTADPYRIWLSEIILQQTRVAQGLPYYQAFTEAFPEVAGLALADEESVLKLWQGLGYYSRARNLHATAKTVYGELDGKFPPDHAGLLRLKGIGDYTAAAIASFAYGEKVPVVDGNVLRVLSRFFGITDDIALPATRKMIRDLAFELMPADRPGLFNQAIMEFGALQCVPKSPDCGVCPFNGSCVALQRKQVSVIPVKARKAKVRERFFHYLVAVDAAGNSVLQKRTGKGIWQHLYEFPVVETPAGATEGDILRMAGEAMPFGVPVTGIAAYHAEAIVHKLSHQHLHIRFWKADVAGVIPGGIPPDEVRRRPVPIVLHNFIASAFPP